MADQQTNQNQQNDQTANQQLRDQLDSYKSRVQKSRRLKRISFIVGLCLVVVAIVGLVLPAATLEFGKTSCGLEEHTHTEACVNTTLVCEIPETVAGNGHVHTPSCYDESGSLVCGKAAIAHMHLQNCLNAEGTQIVCGQEESVHMHTLGCIDPATNTYACGTENLAHVHGETCYELQNGTYVLVCNEPSVGHVHTAICLNPETGEAVCGIQEAIEINHQHDESCYNEEFICGKEEHIHNELCYDEITQSIMKNEEKREEEAAEVKELEGVEAGVAESDMTAEDIDQARDQGLLFENDSMIVTFDVPERYKESIQISVTEVDDPVVFFKANADEEADDNEADDPEEAESDESDDSANQAESLSIAAAEIFANEASTDDTKASDPAYRANLLIEATLDGEPVEDIADLGITAKLQMKPRVIAPILAEIDYSEVAEEVKNEIGAEITVFQQPEVGPEATISEIVPEQVDEVVVTSVSEAAMTFSLLSNMVITETVPTANPKFKVQYYANIPTIQYGGGDASLDVIDTEGGKLPKNGQSAKDLKIKQIALISDGNGGYNVKVENELTEIYTSSQEFKYSNRPGMKYFNKLRNRENYTPVEVWLLKPGKLSDSMNREDWTIYDTTYIGYDESNMDNPWPFTNNPDAVDAICIEDGDVIRLVYDITEEKFNTKESESSKVEFYDYDISNGWIYRAKPPAGYAPDYYRHKISGEVFDGDKLSDFILDWAGDLTDWDKALYTYTLQQGINSSGNYSGSGQKLAFGNVNTGTGLGRLTWHNNGKDNELNKYNNQSYEGCTFGLATGLDRNGNIQYAPGVQAPNLFNKVETTGKTSYDDYSLTFDRVGDTYTLASVQKGGDDVLENLGRFNNPTNSTGTYKTIFTNNFWPMDRAPSFGTDTHDVKFGATSTFNGIHQLRFGPTTQKGSDYNLPQSDDGKYHNSYFGMHFTIDFDVDKEYEGPLEYLFFGDDDLWLFLDGRLVVDLGGIHSSVGEYVNLWDYLPKNDDATYGRHTLQAFYTERGASGSTCYMNFTLPSVSFQATDQVTSDLRISKTVDAPNEDLSGEEYRFDLNMITGGNQNDLYDYKIYQKGDPDFLVSSNRIRTNDTFYLQADQYIVIKNLPIDTKFTVKEVFDASEEGAYITTSTVSSEGTAVVSREASGTVKKDQTVSVDYVNKRTYELPATGGIGTYWYWISGGALVALALLVLWRRRLTASAYAGSPSGATGSSHSTHFDGKKTDTPSGKPEFTYSKGLSRTENDGASTRKGGRH